VSHSSLLGAVPYGRLPATGTRSARGFCVGWHGAAGWCVSVEVAARQFLLWFGAGLVELSLAGTRSPVPPPAGAARSGTRSHLLWGAAPLSPRRDGRLREVVESPSLEIFKTHLDKVICSLLWVTLLRQGGGTG